MRFNQQLCRLYVFTAFVMLALSSPADAWTLRHSSLHESESFHRANETKTFGHTFGGGWSGTRLNVGLSVDDGEVDVKVIGPSGDTRWSRTFQRGKSTIGEKFAAQPGEWRIELRFRNASGRYSVGLTGV